MLAATCLLRNTLAIDLLVDSQTAVADSSSYRGVDVEDGHADQWPRKVAHELCVVASWTQQLLPVVALARAAAMLLPVCLC